MTLCPVSWMGPEEVWSVITKTLFQRSNVIKKKHGMSMSMQYWRVVWTVGFAETKGFDVLTYAHVTSSAFLNWHWLTMFYHVRKELTFSPEWEGVVWNMMLLEGTFENKISIFHRSNSQSKLRVVKQELNKRHKRYSFKNWNESTHSKMW